MLIDKVKETIEVSFEMTVLFLEEDVNFVLVVGAGNKVLVIKSYENKLNILLIIINETLTIKRNLKNTWFSFSPDS